MPRKPKLGPPIAWIETLSDGKRVQAVIVDDFTGELIEPKAEAAKGPIASAQDYRDAQSRKRVDTALRMLQRAGIVKSGADSALQEPKLAANQRKLGDAVMTVPRKPFRRV